jgi:hypothetical protein
MWYEKTLSHLQKKDKTKRERTGEPLGKSEHDQAALVSAVSESKLLKTDHDVSIHPFKCFEMLPIPNVSIILTLSSFLYKKYKHVTTCIHI